MQWSSDDNIEFIDIYIPSSAPANVKISFLSTLSYVFEIESIKISEPKVSV